MLKETTATRLRSLMQTRHLRQIDILEATRPYAEQYGMKMNKSDISQYVSGKVAPSQEKLTILGLALGVSPVWLMGYDVPMNNEVLPDILPVTTRRIPMLGTIACGEPIFAEEDYGNYTFADNSIDCDFALRCKGDSMIGARIQDGDIVFIKKQDTVQEGEIAVVLIDDDATLKRVYRLSDGRMELKAENPKFKPIIVGGEGETRSVYILGKAVAFQSTVV